MDIPDIHHPYHDFSIADAVKLARQHADTFGHPRPSTLDEVRQYIQNMAPGHVWITGMCALDVLDAVIDGKNLQLGCRVMPS